MKGAKLKNKMLQAMYKPGKNDITSTVIGAISEIDKSLDKSLGKLNGKKTKKDDGDKKEEKKDK